MSEYTLDVGDGDLSVKQLTGVFSMNVEQSDMILEVLVIHVVVCLRFGTLWFCF